MKKKIIFYSLIAIFLLGDISFLFAKQLSRNQQLFPRLLFFYSQNCHACQKAKREVIPEIEKEFSDKIIIEYLDTADINNYKLMLSLKEKYKSYEDGMPTVFIEGKILVGYDRVKNGLRKAILEVLEKGQLEKIEKLPGIDLVKYFLSFGTLVVIIAGLIDGINPCAFTVIVFFVTYLAFQGYKKKQLLIIGLTFIFAVFLTYVLVGLGIFTSLYSLEKFYVISKVVDYLIVIFCFTLGILASYDFWLFLKSGKTEDMILQLPQKIKNRIHSVIGLHYRKSKDEGKSIVPKMNFFILIGSTFITGFLVSLLETVCTSQTYVPTLKYILKDASLRLRALGYLLLYNIMFIVPLFVVLLFALFGATSESFSRFAKKHMAAVKISMAILFFGLGILILIKAWR